MEATLGNCSYVRLEDPYVRYGPVSVEDISGDVGMSCGRVGSYPDFVRWDLSGMVAWVGTSADARRVRVTPPVRVRHMPAYL